MPQQIIVNRAIAAPMIAEIKGRFRVLLLTDLFLSLTLKPQIVLYLQHGFFSTGAIFFPQHFGAFAGFSTSDSAPQTLHLTFIFSPPNLIRSFQYLLIKFFC